MTTKHLRNVAAISNLFPSHGHIFDGNWVDEFFRWADVFTTAEQASTHVDFSWPDAVQSYVMMIVQTMVARKNVITNYELQQLAHRAIKEAV